MKLARTIRYALLLAAASVAGSAHAEWVPVAKSSSGAVYYTNTDRLQKNGSKIRFWSKADYSADRTERARSSMIMYSVDCDKNVYRVLSVVRYSASGQVVYNRQQPDYEYGVGYEPITPESVLEAQASGMCAVAATM